MEIIITAAALLTALTVIYKWFWPWVKTGAHVLTAFKNAVLGTEEVKHPDTGAVLVPEQPGLGSRMATIEGAVVELLRNNRRLDDHELRLGRLEEASAERTAARTETVELLRVVDTALKTTPPEGS